MAGLLTAQVHRGESWLRKYQVSIFNTLGLGHYSQKRNEATKKPRPVHITKWSSLPVTPGALPRLPPPRMSGDVAQPKHVYYGAAVSATLFSLVKPVLPGSNPQDASLMMVPYYS